MEKENERNLKERERESLCIHVDFITLVLIHLMYSFILLPLKYSNEEVIMLTISPISLSPHEDTKRSIEFFFAEFPPTLDEFLIKP